MEKIINEKEKSVETIEERKEREEREKFERELLQNMMGKKLTRSPQASETKKPDGDESKQLETDEVFRTPDKKQADKQAEDKKRKWEGTPEEESRKKMAIDDKTREFLNLRNLVEKLANMGEQMMTLIKDNTNTKVEIKKLAKKINTETGHLRKGVQFLEQVEEILAEMRKESEREGEDKNSKISEENDEEKSVAEEEAKRAAEKIEEMKITIQKLEKELEKEKEDRKKREGECKCMSKVISEIPDIEIKYDNYLEMEKYEWGEEAFRKTKITVGNPLETGDEVTKVVMVDPGDEDMSAGIQKMYKEKYPELAGIKEEIEVMEQITKTRRTGKQTRKKVIEVKLDGTHEGTWRRLKQLREETKEDEEICLHHIKSMKLKAFQKMVEAVFNQGMTKVGIYTPVRGEQGMKKRERNTYGVLISDGAKTYKEVLENIKTVMNGRGAVQSIREIKSTKDGRTLMTLDKDRGALKEIKNALAEEGTMKVTTLGEEKHLESIHVRGMLWDTSKEDIRKAIERCVGKWEEGWGISETRPLEGDTLAVTVRVPKKEAEELVNKEYIRIGLARCRTEKRHKVEYCKRCWSYEHPTDGCNQQNRAGNCYKCGKEGHKAAECENPTYCTACNIEGHKQGSRGCHAFRTALKKTRQHYNRGRAMKERREGKQNEEGYSLMAAMDKAYREVEERREEERIEKEEKETERKELEEEEEEEEEMEAQEDNVEDGVGGNLQS
ncbi:uncharacterized protein [Leptinotarsa decemlineata]|uniref:uncharacterized protein n=1 Tax=Leptinotarsa decemlineata TaxID=7539 RepID=UPI003D30459B